MRALQVAECRACGWPATSPHGLCDSCEKPQHARHERREQDTFDWQLPDEDELHLIGRKLA